MKTLFIPCYSGRDPIEVVKKALGKMQDFKKIGLIITAQHLDRLDDLKKFLEDNKKIVLASQILGCTQNQVAGSMKDVDAFLYVGSGRFHPVGVALATGKPVICANPYSMAVDEIPEKERNKWVRRAKARIMKAASAETIGILISTKSGQFQMDVTLDLKEKIESSGKKAFLFAGNEIIPEKLLGFDVDAWINTACPRLVDDYWNKPMLTTDELKYTGLYKQKE